MKYHIPTTSIPLLFSEIYRQWPTANIFIPYSEFEKELELYLSVERLIQKIRNTSPLQIGFHLKEMQGYLFQEKILLKPEHCNGATFRYALKGWGMIYLNTEKSNGNFLISVTVNTQKRAMNWYKVDETWGSPDLWDWKVVQNTQRVLKKILKQFAIASEV